MSAHSHRLRWVGLNCLLTACDGASPVEDGGPQPDGTSVVAGSDSGPAPDHEPPRVTSTRPASNAELVARASTLEVRFSEPVVASSGSISATSGGATVALGATSWEPEGDVLRVAAVDGWPGGAPVEVRIAGFTDAAGSAQDGAHELLFFSSDEGSVREAAPLEGASNVDPALDGPHNSVDITASNGPFQAISCREEPFGNVVLAFPKAVDDAVLDVRVGGASVTAEAITGACRGDDPAATRAACVTFASAAAPRDRGRAGRRHVRLGGGHLEQRGLPGWPGGDLLDPRGAGRRVVPVRAMTHASMDRAGPDRYSSWVGGLFQPRVDSESRPR